MPDARSRNNPDAHDIVMPEFGYAKQWNLGKDSSLWIMAPDSIDEVGCIQTFQGLELDYLGVITDRTCWSDGALVSAPENRSSMDRSIRGYKRMAKFDPEATRDRVDAIIRNTYRTLMTRGMKGCYVFCVDEETRGYLEGRLASES